MWLSSSNNVVDRSTHQVKDDFCEFFIDRAGDRENASPPGPPPPLTVSLEGFREYYRDVGVCEPYDTVFVAMIEVSRRRKGVEGGSLPLPLGFGRRTGKFIF